MNTWVGVLVMVMVTVGVVRAYVSPLTLFTAQEVAVNGARCLDGTSAGYYLHKSTTTAYQNKWYIYLQGGGWCFANSTYSNVEDCYNRAKGSLGSSNGRATTRDIGFLRDYNIVWVFYCSGDFYSGARNTSLNGLYYSGHLILVGIIGKLKAEQGMNNADFVLINGDSAGGLGVIVNFDYVKSQFPSAAVKAWPNAGWFPESVVPATGARRISMSDSYKILYNQTNAYLNQACVSTFSSTPWVCYSGQYVYPVANVPMFISQSVFDNWAQGFNGAGNISSPSGLKFETHYGQAMRNTFKNVITSSSATGLFLTTDNVHVISTGAKINGTSLGTLVLNWIDGNGLVKLASNCSYVNCAAAPTQGCYSDSAGNRDLTFAGILSPIQTIERCSYYCGVRNYKYAGLQNGTQCWCGSSFGRNGPALYDCNTACPGDLNYEFCGAVYRNSVFLSGDVGYLGCFQDNSTRDLPVQTTVTGPMTVEKCRIKCNDLAYKYAGMQNGTQCFCGNEYGRFRARQMDAECSTACTGDLTEKCGAAWKNSVYTAVPSASIPAY